MKKIPITIYLGLALIAVLISSNRIVILQTKPQIYSSFDNVPKTDVALVLGARKDGRFGLNPYFKYRMEAAITLYNLGKVNRILVSGDNQIADYNETQDMANYLLDNGIPNSAIIKDFAGFRTFDSVTRAKKVFGLSSITIISQKFHNQKALFIANYIDLQAIAFNAQDVNSKHNYTHYRSYLAKCLAIFDLYIIKRKPKFL